MRSTYEIRPAAEYEYDEAADCYKNEDPAVRDEFVMSVDATISKMINAPLMFPIVGKTKVRRAIVYGFPYSIFFMLVHNHIVLLSIFHNSRNPMIWRGRVS